MALDPNADGALRINPSVFGGPSPVPSQRAAKRRGSAAGPAGPVRPAAPAAGTSGGGYGAEAPRPAAAWWVSGRDFC